MDDNINTYAYREQECAGRSLATLLISWVAVAMLGAILLRWEHMWIALTILTLLFLMMCAYAIKLKRSNVRDEYFQQEEVRTQIPSVSAAVEDFSEVIQPPPYQNFWINDLPPSYSEISNQRDVNLNPPPYCAVQVEDTAGNLNLKY